MISQREVLEISDSLAAETATIEKLGFYANHTTDPELRRTFLDIQSLHMRHYDMLLRELEMANQMMAQPYSGQYAGQYGAGAGAPYGAGGQAYGGRPLGGGAWGAGAGAQAPYRGNEPSPRQ